MSRTFSWLILFLAGVATGLIFDRGFQPSHEPVMPLRPVFTEKAPIGHPEREPSEQHKEVTPGELVDNAASKEDKETHLKRLVTTPFHGGKITSEKTNEWGERATTETLDDGSTLIQSFSAAGALKGETLTQPDGESILRSYAPDGHETGFQWSQTTGEKIRIMLSGDGSSYVGRTDQLPSGEKYYYHYDSDGNVTEKWLESKDGKLSRVL
jgi:hypothetical protein